MGGCVSLCALVAFVGAINASWLHVLAKRDAAFFSLPPALLAKSAMARSCDFDHVPYADFGSVESSAWRFSSAAKGRLRNR
eukprot:4445303-Prymnesium_polylepis.2